MGGKGVIVGNKKVAMMLMLHLDEVPEGPDIIAQVKVSGRPDAADNCFHGAKVNIFFKSAVSGQQSAVWNLESGIWNPFQSSFRHLRLPPSVIVLLSLRI
jgi:hypothetical protein